MIFLSKYALFIVNPLYLEGPKGLTGPTGRPCGYTSTLLPLLADIVGYDCKSIAFIPLSPLLLEYCPLGVLGLVGVLGLSTLIASAP